MVADFYRDDWKVSNRHLTEKGYAHANALIEKIATGRSKPVQEEARKNLVAFMLPVAERYIKHEIDLANAELAQQNRRMKRGEREQLKSDLYDCAIDSINNAANSITRDSAVSGWSGVTTQVHSKIKDQRKNFVEALSENAPTAERFTKKLARHLLYTPKEKSIYPSTPPGDIPSVKDYAIDHAMRHQLNYREREVIKMRYPLNGDEPCTLEETGKAFHVTTERIRQIESKALNKLRKYAGTDAENPKEILDSLVSRFWGGRTF